MRPGREFLLLLPLAVLCAKPLALRCEDLTPSDVQDGWISLFDGTSMYGWTSQGGGKWKVSGGALSADPAEPGFLRSSGVFGDFVLKCEFRMSGEGDSGIVLRESSTSATPEAGYEINICNSDPDFPTGSLVNRIKASPYKALPKLWHQLEAQAIGDRLTVLIDGIRLVDARDSTWKAGHIGLVAPSKARVEFRNLRLKPQAMKPLFNAQNMNGWRATRAPQARAGARWSVRDGAIHMEGGPGQLETLGTFDDFVLQLEVRVPPLPSGGHVGSGVFVRGDPQQFWSGYEIQIRNEYEGNDRKNPVEFGTGGIAGLQPARMVVSDDSATDFLAMTIVARGPDINVWVNGQLVTSYEDVRPVGKSARTQARLTKGTIALQAESTTDGVADFRDVRIAVLPPGPPTAAPPEPTPAPPTTVPTPPAPQVPVAPIIVPAGPDPAEVARQEQITKLLEQALKTSEPAEQVRLYEQILVLAPGNQVAYNGRKDALAEVERRRAANAQQAQQEATKRQQTAEQIATRQSAVRRAEEALLRGDITAAHNAITLARSVAPNDPEVLRLGTLIGSRVARRQRLFYIGGGLGAASLLGLLLMLIRRGRRKTPFLEIIQGIDKGKRYAIDRDAICIGAIEKDGGDKNDIVVHDVERMISRFHCEIHRRGRKLYLFDCGSANGTFRDGKRIPAGKPVPLKRGSRVDLAHVCIMRLTYDRPRK